VHDNVPYQIIPYVVIGLIVLIVVLKSFRNISPAQVGLLSKSFGKKLPNGKLIAEHGEAGYQPDLFMPGWHFKLWPLYKIKACDRVQIPMNGIGLIVAQVGAPVANGAKTAAYSSEIGDFSDLRKFLANGGQRGVQRPVLPPGATLPIHPIAFVVYTSNGTFGQPLSRESSRVVESLRGDSLLVTEIKPDKGQDMVGVVTTLDGPPLESGDMAGRLGDFTDVSAIEEHNGDPNEVIQELLGSKNQLHNNFQDFEAFLNAGGKIGLQHDVLLYGTYLLNPILISVERVPMLVVEQGEVAVIKSYVGLPTEDTSGEGYQFGTIVRPGHRGTWSEPLRTGKYPLNPHLYDALKVPTSILTLNWARATSEAHDLDSRLSSIDAKSKEAFDFQIDLQVLIHVPDIKAPQVIGMVGTMENLVNDVLQSAVGNYFRNSLQALGAIEFIATRKEVQQEAEKYVGEYLSKYDVEVRGVYIQDVVFPDDLVKVLRSREIAKQEIETYGAQQVAQEARVSLENSQGTADAQADLARSKVSIEIKGNEADAQIQEVRGQAAVITQTGQAEAEKIRAVGVATAEADEAKGVAAAVGYMKQREAIGEGPTSAVAIVQALANGGVKITPDTVVGDSSGSIGGLLTLLLADAVKPKTNGNTPSAADATAQLGNGEIQKTADVPSGDDNLSSEGAAQPVG
jgi:uncharacterized membrane protein YqiK